MPKVLMVAYYFPPLGGSGVQRSLKFARYLPEFGWQPHVLTTRRGLRGEVTDPTLLAELPPAVQITRTPRLDLTLLPKGLRRLGATTLARWLGNLVYFLPDAQIGWLPGALFPALRLAHQSDVIYSTSTPYTNHLVGWWLKWRTGKPWIADFRDEWTANPDLHYPGPAFLALNRAVECRLLRAADRVLVTSRLHGASQRTLLPPEQRTKVRLLHNGFDSADIAPRVAETHNQRFTIIHTGSVYGIYQPDTLIAAVADLVERGKIPADQIRLLFVGVLSRQLPVPASLSAVIECTGYVTHETALQLLASADVAAIFRGVRGVAADGRGGLAAIPGKMFEYWMLNKPVLALAPQASYAAELLRNAGYTAICEPDDVAGIAELVATMYDQWRRGELVAATNPEYVARFERRTLTGELAAIFNEVSA